MQRLHEAGVDAIFHQIHSAHGHYATTEESDKWTPLAKEFLLKLDAR